MKIFRTSADILTRKREQTHKNHVCPESTAFSINTFTYFWCFLELFIWNFILNINNEHAQNYSCPGATFAFCSNTWRKVTLERLVTWCCTTGNPPLKVAPGQGEIHVNSYRRQTMHRGKVSGFSDLPRGNELSQDNANRP